MRIHLILLLDIHQSLLALPSRLPDSLSPQATHIIRLLRPVLLITPSSTLLPTLPYAEIVRVPRQRVMHQGRPTVKTRRENYLLGLERLSRDVQALDEVVTEERDDQPGEPSRSGMNLPSAEEYMLRKEELLALLEADEQHAQALRDGTGKTQRRMREIEAWATREGQLVEGYDWEGKPIGLGLVERDGRDDGKREAERRADVDESSAPNIP
jgi:hypothetical protein